MKRPDRDETVHGDRMLGAFIATVNANRHWTGPEEIPQGRFRPHMFHRAPAMLTDQVPRLGDRTGLQLKHVATRALANRSTQGCAALDTQWAELLDTAVEAVRFRRFKGTLRPAQGRQADRLRPRSRPGQGGGRPG